MADEGKSGQQGGDGGSQSHMVPEGEGGEGAKSGGEGGQGQGSQGSGDQGGQQKSDEDKLAEKVLGLVTGKLDEQGQKIADRLVNAQPKQLEKIVSDAVKAASGGGSGEGGKGGEGKGQEGQQQQTGPSEADLARAEQDRKRLVRDARSAYRDILSEDVKFLGNFEREAAMEFGSLFIASAVVGGQDDEEAIGREASKRFQAIMESMRKGYEGCTKAGLRKAGVLKETAGQTGSSGAGAQAGGAASAFAAGAKKAQDKFGKPDEKANPNASASTK